MQITYAKNPSVLQAASYIYLQWLLLADLTALFLKTDVLDFERRNLGVTTKQT